MRALDDLRSDTAKLVALYLRQVGDATPKEIADRLDLRLLTVLATLSRLDEKRLIERLDGSDRVVFAGPGGSPSRERPGAEQAEGRPSISS